MTQSVAKLSDLSSHQYILHGFILYNKMLVIKATIMWISKCVGMFCMKWRTFSIDLHGILETNVLWRAIWYEIWVRQVFGQKMQPLSETTQRKMLLPYHYHLDSVVSSKYQYFLFLIFILWLLTSAITV